MLLLLLLEVAEADGERNVTVNTFLPGNNVNPDTAFKIIHADSNPRQVVSSARDTCSIAQTRDRKVASSNPDRSGGKIFFSRVNFVC